MERAEYDVMAASEDSHWWYRGLRRLVVETLEAAFPGAGPRRIVDVGCGTGGCARAVRRRFASVRCVGIDSEPRALRHCRASGMQELIRASASELPVRPASADAVICLDVLYYPSIRADTAIRQFFDVLRPGGVLILNLPAFQTLRGQHDLAVAIGKRYRLGEMRALCAAAGFQIVRATYWNAALFVPLAVWRWLSRPSLAAGVCSDVARSPRWLNPVFDWILSAEAAAMRWVTLPCGSSAFVVARRPRIPDPERDGA